MSKTAIIISPNWRDYAKKYLQECLVSITEQDFKGEVKVFLVDNESTAESLEYINKLAQDILINIPWQVLTNDKNEGFAKGNNVAMAAAIDEGYDYLALFNMDGILAPSCLSSMIIAVEQDVKVGAVQARLMLWPEADKINSLGNVTHFLGFGYCEGNGEFYQKPKNDDYKKIAYPSGAAVLFRASALKKIGLFDEKFWMYNEDQDLGWRLWLTGYTCIFANSAVFFHKYKFAKSIKQFYWQDRNRFLSAGKNYHWLTLLIFTPAYLISEVGLWLTAWRGGWFKERIKVYVFFCLPSTWLYLMKARRQTQKLRTVSDRQILKTFSGQILNQEINSPFVQLANFGMEIYFRLAKLIIFW